MFVGLSELIGVVVLVVELVVLVVELVVVVDILKNPYFYVKIATFVNCLQIQKWAGLLRLPPLSL